MFDIDLLAGRLAAVTAGCATQPRVPRACRSATSGPAPARRRRCGRPPTTRTEVAAVVSRGGRPDLAAPRLARYGRRPCSSSAAADAVVLELNRRAQAAAVPDAAGRRARCHPPVRGARHAERGGRRLARDWFTRHLLPPHIEAPAKSPRSFPIRRKKRHPGAPCRMVAPGGTTMKLRLAVKMRSGW